MSMDAIQQLMGGGGPPPQAAQSDPNVNSQASAGPPPPDPNAGPPAPDDPNAQSGGDPQSQAVDLINQMIELAKQYIAIEPDEEDKLTMTKNILATLQQYLAKDQKDEQDMLSGTISPRAMRKAGAAGA